jgi:ATP-dependent RNA helicase DeaD
VLINTREKYKIDQIERKINQKFIFAEIPVAETICAIQLDSMIQKVKDTEVNEKEIEKFIPEILEDFKDLSKEEVIKKFVSAQFNKFLEYYQKAGDLNAPVSNKSEEPRNKNSRGRREDTDPNKARFFVSLGEKDGLNAGGLLRVICDATGLKSNAVGRIDILPAFSFFDADKSEINNIIHNVKDVEFEGKKLKVELTDAKKPSGSRGAGGRSNRSGGGGNSRSRGGARPSKRRATSR